MNIQRLKFAYARGARIQVPEGAVKWLGDPSQGPWVTVNMPYWSPHQKFRIHPEDEHLQYGPLSTALRNRVLDTTYQTTHWNTPALGAANVMFHYEIGKDYGGTVDDDYHMALLFFAELLADEGL